MDLQKWMTRFQLTGNRLIESWMDLLPEVLITSPEAISLFSNNDKIMNEIKMNEHKWQQQHPAQILT